MRAPYFFFFAFMSSLLFFSCEEESKELTFEDIPHKFLKEGSQGGAPALNLQLFENGDYHLTSTFYGCLINLPIKMDDTLASPKLNTKKYDYSGTCTDGKYQIKDNFLELIPKAVDSIIFDYRKQYHLSKYYQILDFDSICILVKSQDKKGNFDKEEWSIRLASYVKKARHYFHEFKNVGKHQITYDFLTSTAANKLPHKYQSYLKDTIELQVTQVSDEIIVERHFGKFRDYLTLTLNKGKKQGIEKGFNFFLPKEQLLRKRSSWDPKSNLATVTKVYPNKCEAKILVKSVEEEDWIRNNAKIFYNLKTY